MFFISKVFLIFVHLCSALRTETTKNNGLELYPPWSETHRYVNESYEVTCKSYESFTNLTWVKSQLPNGLITEKSGRIRTQKIQHGVVLIFDSLTFNAEGYYQCMAIYNGVDRQSRGFTLYVAEPIVFSSPTVLQAVINEDVFLECKVNGKYIPNKYWEFNGNMLDTAESYEFRTEGLLIPNVGLQHAGRYLCIIAHSPFQSNRNRLDITLLVYHKPMFQDSRKKDTTVYGFVNEICSIVCTVMANPKPWFIWYSKFKNALNPKNDNLTLSTENNTSTLQVILTEHRTEEYFTCEACNELGCAEQIFYLRTTTKLKKPDVGLWDTYSDSAKFYVSFQKEATYYLFHYFFIINDYNWEKPFIKNFTVGIRKPQLGSYMSFQLPNLHPDTKYIVKVAAGNQYTISDFSEERKFKTRLGSSIYVICSGANSQNCNHG